MHVKEGNYRGRRKREKNSVYKGRGEESKGNQ